MTDETDAMSEVARVADVLRVHWLRPTGSRYGGSEPVTTRMCNCMHTLKPQYFEWRHYAEHNAHVAEALSTAGLLRPQIATQEPAGATQGGSGDSRVSGGLGERLRALVVGTDPDEGAYESVDVGALLGLADEAHRLEVHARVVEQSLRTARGELAKP